MNKLLIIGAGGHGKVVADIAQRNGYSDIAFLDDNAQVDTCLGYPIIGTSSEISKYIGYDIFVAVGNSEIRERLMNSLECMNIVTLIHPNSMIADDVKIGKGSVVMAGAVINPGTVIGSGCIINTGATVDHDNRIGDYVHVSVGCHLAGTVNVGKHTWVGVGAVVSNNIDICDNCMIGAGTVVVRNINKPGTYIGVPARAIGDSKMEHLDSKRVPPR